MGTLLTYFTHRVLTGGYYPRIPFKSVICCEPMSMDKDTGEKAGAIFGTGPANRRDVWSSKQDAYTDLKARGIWKTWDDRVLRNYVVRRHIRLVTWSMRSALTLLPGHCLRANGTSGQQKGSYAQVHQSSRDGQSQIVDSQPCSLTNQSVTGLLPGPDRFLEDVQLSTCIRQASEYSPNIWRVKRLHVRLLVFHMRNRVLTPP